MIDNVNALRELRVDAHAILKNYMTKDKDGC